MSALRKKSLRQNNSHSPYVPTTDVLFTVLLITNRDSERWYCLQRVCQSDCVCENKPKVLLKTYLAVVAIDFLTEFVCSTDSAKSTDLWRRGRCDIGMHSWTQRFFLIFAIKNIDICDCYFVNTEKQHSMSRREAGLIQQLMLTPHSVHRDHQSSVSTIIYDLINVKPILLCIAPYKFNATNRS